MQSKDNGDGSIALKLDDSENLMECLRKTVETHKITSAFVLMGIGMLRDAEIGYFTGKAYEKKIIKNPHELVSLQGSISTKGEIVIHLHCSLANEKHELVGGHLFEATVCVLNEILIRKTDNVLLSRRLNPATGLKEMVIG